jgi:hypothetical protein
VEQRVKVYLTLESYIDLWRNGKWNVYGWVAPKAGYVVEMLIHSDDITSLNDQGGISFKIRR